MTTASETPEQQAPAGTNATDPANTDVSCSRRLPKWLAANEVSLVFTSYQSGIVFFVGTRPDGGLAIHQAGFPRAMGLSARRQRIYLASLAQIWRLENMLRPGELANQQYDVCYVPRNAQTTGDVDAHEIAVEPDGRVIFVNTSYSCLATLDQVHGFKPIWQPSFISKLAPEDRCHLNGLAMENGKARYVTAVSQSDVVNGWRDRRSEGGVLIDIASDKVLTDRLSMPHSPRLHNGQLYTLNSGRGHLARIDRQTGDIDELAFLPGFLRGLAFHKNHAIVTLSLPRDRSFAGLELDDELKKRDADAWCGIQIVELSTGNVVHWLRLDGSIRELFDVAVLPEVRCPLAVSPLAPEFASTTTMADTD
ncbi:MAG: TIGR03032 family protein [Opitutaceae bacterium]|nr:TIGR03032 family protein [Opitutaceae bacterium]